MTDVATIQRRGLGDFVRWMGGGSAGASTFEAPGVVGAVVPATPERSIVNSVVYDSADSLAAVYDALVAAYRDAGVRAWTVWTPEGDSKGIEVLTGNGHVFDGKPGAMTLDDLAAFEAPPADGLDWDDRAPLSELARINDEAYGLTEPDGMATAMSGMLGVCPSAPTARV